MSSDGTFRPNYRDGVCSVCKRDTEFQSGTSVCDNCLVDRLMVPEICLWQRADGRVGWSESAARGTPIQSYHQGWGRAYEAGTVGADGWRRTTTSELGLTIQEVKHAG